MMPVSANAATPLAEEITQLIRHDGPMPLSRYMDLCLCHPRLGFYMHDDPFGTAGHFITAPEVSQMFGELIGIWCGAVWTCMGAPDGVRLVELGPGRGTLMADLLRAAAKVPGFLDAARIHLVEKSSALRRRQQEALAGHAGHVSWHERIEDVPDGPAIVVANEFLDALPVRQFVRLENGWHERLVGIGNDGRLVLGAAADPSPSTLVPVPLRDASPGTVVEISPAVNDAIATLSGRLVEAGGAALLIDYGYTAPAAGDSLQAVRRHGFADILEAPGECDLTAHVDFAAVADGARAAGAMVCGPLSQRDFLRRMGLEVRAAALRKLHPARTCDVDDAVRRLTDPAQMGELFKVLALTAPDLPTPPPFSGTPG